MFSLIHTTMWDLDIFQKQAGLWVLLQSGTFLSLDLLLLLIGKVWYFFQIKRWYKIVTVKILNLLLLFNRRYWALNTNKWNDKKGTQPNIQKW